MEVKVCVLLKELHEVCPAKTKSRNLDFVDPALEALVMSGIRPQETCWEIVTWLSGFVISSSQICAFLIAVGGGAREKMLLGGDWVR